MFNDENNMSCELHDLLEMIKRYNATCPNGCFVFAFVGFERDMENICEECGDHCDKISDKHTISGGHGDVFILRDILNSLRDMVEEEKDDEGFVSF